MIKNNTPYLGKIFLTFEKFPEYTGKTVLNKIHLDIGFTKIVSRIKPDRTSDGNFSIDPKKIELIGKYTGGKIGDYWVDNRDPKDEFTLKNYFLSSDDVPIGCIRDGWLYYQNRLIVSQKYPKGVAIKVKESFFSMNRNKVIIESYSEEFIEGFYGYTHRGGCIFKIGDRIFDPDYYPMMEDYDREEWTLYRDRLERKLSEDIEKTGLAEIFSLRELMPFNRRGKNIIQNWDEAEESAKKLSEYLS
jgi:hypothetical protein